MARILFIRLDNFDFEKPEATRLDWVVVNESGSVLESQSGTAAEIDWPQGTDRVVACVPANDIIMTTVSLPGGNRQKLLRAVPYAVEEQIIDDVETLHFALSEKPDGERYRVAAVSDELIASWLALFENAAVQVNLLVPDVLCLPWQESEWTLLLDSGSCLIRVGRYEGYAFEPENLSIYLRSLLKQKESALPERIQVFSGLPESEVAVLLQDFAGETEILAHQIDAKNLLQFLASNIDFSNSLNLLQGKYRREQNWKRVLRPWSPAAALFVAWFVVQTAVNVVHYHALSVESDQLENEIEKIFKSTFPGSKIVRGRTKERMQQLTAELRKRSGKNESSLQQVLMLVGPELARNRGVEVRNFQYRDGILEFQLEAKQSSSIDRLKQTLSRSDEWEIETRTSTKEGRVESRLTIRRKKA